MAYTLANLQTDIRGYTEVSASTVLTDGSFKNYKFKMLKTKFGDLYPQIKMLITQHLSLVIVNNRYVTIPD